MNLDTKHFLNEIFDIESKGMLNDIMLTPRLFSKFVDFDKNRIKKSIGYIKNVLNKSYESGSVKVFIMNDGEELLGYAILFLPINLDGSAYLHKVFVKEKYRRNGIGSSILEGLIEASYPISLLCSYKNIGFYEKYGFKYIQEFHAPKTDNFKLSKELFEDFCVMCNSESNSESPIFFLNDADLNFIIEDS